MNVRTSCSAASSTFSMYSWHPQCFSGFEAWSKLSSNCRASSARNSGRVLVGAAGRPVVVGVLSSVGLVDEILKVSSVLHCESSKSEAVESGTSASRAGLGEIAM